jgi:hypothetical protein
MSFTITGAGIITAKVVRPALGAWTADVEVDSTKAITGTVRLELPGVSLTGTVMEGGVSYLRQHLRLVGGRGGLGKSVSGQHFFKGTTRTVVDHTLAEAGEQLAQDSDAGIMNQTLDHWQRLKGTAGRELSRLTDHLSTGWSVKPDGSVRIGLPLWTMSSVEVDLLGEDLVNRSWVLACNGDVPSPGTTVRGKRVVSVEHTVTGTALRSTVRW